MPKNRVRKHCLLIVRYQFVFPADIYNCADSLDSTYKDYTLAI
jgi:hypothetical protein